MTFLTPTIGIIAAGLTIPAVLLLYFLKLRRRPVRVSTIRFWVSSADDLQVNAPFRMIRLSWLLLLHLLAAALLCTAAARPALDQGSLAQGRVIILIDHSASMSAQDAPAPKPNTPPITRLEAAKAEAKKVIEGLDSTNAQAMLVSLAARPVTRANFTRDAGALRQAVDAIEPTDQPANLAEALQLVAAFARPDSADTAASQSAPTLVVISDGVLPLSPEDTVPGLGALTTRLVQVGPRPGNEPGNIGIVALSARRDFQNPALLRIFVRLQSTLPTAANVGITCRLNDEPPHSAVVELAATPPTTAATPTPAPPAEASRTFELRTTDGGVLTISLSRRDALQSDNEASLVIAPAKKPRILLVRPNAEAEKPTGADENLRAALETLDPASLTLSTADRYRAAAATMNEAADLIVFDRVYPDTLPPRTPTISFAAALPIEGLRISARATAPGGFTQWDRAHPVMRYVALGDVALDAASEIVTATLPQGYTATPLAWARQGPAVVLLDRAGVRRLLIGVDLNTTTWSKEVSFPTFMANAVDHLTLRGDDNTARAWRTTEAIAFPAPPSSKPGETLSISGPPDITTPIPEATISDDAGIMVGILPRVGVYQINTPTTPTPIAVNLLDPTESEARTKGTVDIAGRTATADPGVSLGAVEIWPWFVLAALVVLCLEWLLFAWRSRV